MQTWFLLRMLPLSVVRTIHFQYPMALMYDELKLRVNFRNAPFNIEVALEIGLEMVSKYSIIIYVFSHFM